MERQKKQVDLTREEIREMIKELEPGTMLTLEMPDRTTETEDESGTD